MKTKTSILKKPFRSMLVLLLFVTFTQLIAAKKSLDDEKLFSSKANDVVYFIPQFTNFEEISHSEMAFLKKTLKKAERENVKAVIFELDTPGGRVDYAMKYLSVLSRSKVPTIAFINPHGISAGMIIALGADRIAINSNGLIGDAMPIQMSMGGIKPITEKPEEEKPAKSDTAGTEKEEKTKKSDKKTEKKEGEGTAKKPDEKEKKSDKEDDKKDATDKKKEKETAAEKENKEQLKKIVKELEDLKKNMGKETLTEEEKKIADQKFLTVFFKTLEVLAKKNDRPVRVIRAMADPYQQLTVKEDGIDHSKKSPLTLSAEEAKKLHVVDYICDDRDELLDRLGLENCEVVIVERSFFEQIASFLASPMLSGILIMLGVLGLYIEVRTPGFGVPGILGVCCLALFFLGHIGAGDSHWGAPVIFFIGIVLLALEVFVIPGFGIVGILGICCLLTSLFMAFGFENFQSSVYVVGLSLLGSIVLMILLTFYVLPKTTLFKRITLSKAQHEEEGYIAHEKRDDSLLEKVGVAYTTLRPTGIMMLDDQRYDVVTEGDFIEKGEQIMVTKVKGLQIIVKKVS